MIPNPSANRGEGLILAVVFIKILLWRVDFFPADFIRVSGAAEDFVGCLLYTSDAADDN